MAAPLQIRPSAQTALDVFAPPDDGGAPVLITSDPEVRMKNAPSGLQIRQPAPALAIRSPAATGPVIRKTAEKEGMVAKALDNPVTHGIEAGGENMANLLTMKNLPTPVLAEIKAKQARGEPVNWKEYVGAFNEGFTNSPGGQAMGAVFNTLGGALAPVVGGVNKGLEKVGMPHEVSEAVENISPALGIKALKEAPKVIDAAAGMADKAMQPVRKGLAPASVSPGAARVAAIKREQVGEATRDTAASAAALEKHAPRFDKLTPQEEVDFPRYMETYSKPGAVRPALPPELKAAADDLRKSYQFRADKIKNTKSMKNMPLVADYIVRNFKGTPQQQAAFTASLAGKQGRGGFTRQRKYPTYEQALQAAQKAGMPPVEPNFIKAANLYNANTDMFIAHNRAWDAMRKEGLIKYGPPNRPPPGWVPLEGRMSFKVGVDKKSGQPIQLQAYAPVDAARVYNNYLSKGLTGDAGGAMRTAQKAFNAITMLKLGLSSVWHAGITGTAAISSDLARGTRQALKGEPVKGLKSIAGSPFAPYRVAKEGAKFHQQYLRMTDYGPNVEKLVRTATKANTLQSKRPAYMDSAGPKTFKQIIKSANSVPAAVGGTAAHAFGKVMQGVSAPMFDKWIPNMKRGVILERLQQWMAEHPQATEAEQLTYARQLGDAVDNRFGEMMRDNLFWNRTLRDAMQFGLLSYSWVAGATRMVGGAAKELYRTGKHSDELGPNAEYLIANAVVAAALNAAYQYMHTGQGPQDIEDLFFPRSGGKQYVGKAQVPERVVLPTGHWTQIAEYLHDPLAELYNEGNPGAKIMWEALHNRDYRGMPIAKPTDLWSADYLKEVPVAVWRYMQYIGGQALTPIAVSAYYNRNKGTGITPAEAIGLAARPAPGFISAPEKIEQFSQKADRRLWKAKQKSDTRLKSRKGSAAPAEVPPLTILPPGAPGLTIRTNADEPVPDERLP